MRNKIPTYLLLSLLTILLLIKISSQSKIPRPKRQTDALNKLIFDPRILRRHVSRTARMTLTSLSNSAVSKVYSQVGQKEKDKIQRLPGQPKTGVNFNQYGGYVTVDVEKGRAFYYYFVEAATRGGDGGPDSKPLLLWLNGGPGCSSLGYGAMEELGPFRVKSDGKSLYHNPFSWNRVANVLFLESPAGVGFSYSNTTKDYSHNGDTMTAQDNLVFLVNWLERFPEYKGREFYMAGESYASHYIPQLAQAIFAHNRQNKGQDSINLKGIMLGNAVLNDDTDTSGMYDFFWTHALISDSTIDAIHKTCNLSLDSGGPTCTALDDVDSDIATLTSIISMLHCARIQAQEALQKHLRYDSMLYKYYKKKLQNLKKYAKNFTFQWKKDEGWTLIFVIENFDPCSDYYVEAYLNTPEVQDAMHANITKLKQRWSSCSDVISSWGDTVPTVLPILTELLSKGTRIWVYSGDVDGRIPITSTRYSLNQLQLPVKIPWGAWYLNNQVGGFSTTYEGNLTLVTVRGAGHEVPSYQPARSLMLVQYFIAGKPLPAN